MSTGAVAERQVEASVEVAVKLLGLTKQFGSERAVDDLSLVVQRGSTFGLIGPNGAGKSTTMKMMMGMMRPTSGRASVLGHDVLTESLELKQRVGYVPEAHTMHGWMRVREAIDFCRAIFSSWNDATCREMLERFELNPKKKVRQLSKGMKVKLSLVLAVSHEPELLLLDEPMAGLDPLAREEFLDGVLRTICERGQTVMISTHSLDDVQRLADTVGILFDGRMLVVRKIDELLATTKRLRATLKEERQPAQFPDGVIWQEVRGREWIVTVGDFRQEMVGQLEAVEGVERVEVIDVGLEDLFKDLVRGGRAER